MQTKAMNPTKIDVYKDIHQTHKTYAKTRKPLALPFALLLKVALFAGGFVFPLGGLLVWVLIREAHPAYSKYIGLGTFLGYFIGAFMNVVPRFHGLPLW